MSIPEPLSFNGGPHDTGGEVKRATGPWAEPDADRESRPLCCDMCARAVQYVHSLADVGVFCSAQCRDKATVPAQQQDVA